ncbi:MAG: polysaccharide deacetylase family protein [Acutalibacteraceae bacterium]
MKNITRILSAALALCLLAALCLPARADGTQDCGAKLLAITFDDGPGKYTGALLDGLAERGVHATFFAQRRQRLRLAGDAEAHRKRGPPACEPYIQSQKP